MRAQKSLRKRKNQLSDEPLTDFLLIGKFPRETFSRSLAHVSVEKCVGAMNPEFDRSKEGKSRTAAMMEQIFLLSPCIFFSSGVEGVIFSHLIDFLFRTLASSSLLMRGKTAENKLFRNARQIGSSDHTRVFFSFYQSAQALDFLS